MNTELPDGSIFDAEDYKRMKQLASDPACHDILELLHDNELGIDAMAEHLERDQEAVQRDVTDLSRVALVRTRIDPNREPSRYHTITNPGETILERGVEDGVRHLMRQEWVAEETYSQ